MMQPGTRAKMCPTTYLVQQNDTSQAERFTLCMYMCIYIYGSSMIVFLVIILLFERRTHDVTCRNMHVKLVDNLCCASK